MFATLVSHFDQAKIPNHASIHEVCRAGQIRLGGAAEEETAQGDDEQSVHSIFPEKK
jgi:hypothetical protein